MDLAGISQQNTSSVTDTLHLKQNEDEQFTMNAIQQQLYSTYSHVSPFVAFVKVKEAKLVIYER